MKVVEAVLRLRETLRGFRTMLVASLMAVVGVLEASTGALRNFLSPTLGEAWTGMAIVALSAVFAVLRVITSTPLGKKG